MSRAWTTVVTAGGSGTRFLPFSSVVAKELLPIGPEPAIGRVVKECLASGSRSVVVVTRPDDTQVGAYLKQHFDDPGAEVVAVPEETGFGYGNAAPILTVRERVRALESFGVAFGDDVILGDGDLAAMRAMLTDGVEAVVAAQVVSRADIGSFGAVEVDPVQADRVVGIRQRPDPATVVEPLALVSRLILRPSVLDFIRDDGPSGEVDLGTALHRMSRVAEVRVHRLRSPWVTVGDPRQYFMALQRYWGAIDNGLSF